MAKLQMDERERKAVKSDDAAVPIGLWTAQFLEGGAGTWSEEEVPAIEAALETLRHKLFVHVWRRRVFRSFHHWIQREHLDVWKEIEDGLPSQARHFVVWDDSHQCYHWEGLSPGAPRYLSPDAVGRVSYCRWRSLAWSHLSDDLEAGWDALGRNAEADWWEWNGGSRPYHWRWPKYYQEQARDGIRVHFQERAPLYTVPQPDTPDPTMKERLIKKLRKVRDRGYVGKWLVLSLTAYFAVAKGLDDIRVVYDGTKSGLNDAVWIPGFWLPTIWVFLRMVGFGAWMSDLDVGEMFLNFVLHSSLRPYCGVDLTHYFPEELQDGETQLLEAWLRTGMGFTWSPYQAVQGMMVVDEVIGGDRFDPSNVFRWDNVCLNLPGDPAYDPTMPWVYKCRLEDGLIAADRVIFVDDVRTVGNSRAECWQATRVVGSQLSYHGIQDASRKRRQVSQSPGAWAGSVVWTDAENVHLLVSDDKWDKTKAQVKELREMVELDSEALPRKRLEEIRGFLNYVCQTYKGLAPYLNGLHLTIDGWRNNRDQSGWRLRRRFMESSDELKTEKDASDRGPKTVKAMPRLLRDIGVMERLTSPTKPPLRPVRGRKVVVVMYGFGDASGPGFGFCHQEVGSDGIEYEFGQWPCEVTQERSSNWRELGNMVEGVRRLAERGGLEGAELFLATDNSTTESAYAKGYSSSERLDELVVDLRWLELVYCFTLYLFHVSGRRMIKQGTDGLSRGDRSTGSMLGHPIWGYVPLNISAFQRSPLLEEWCIHVCSDLGTPTVLTPEGWFSSAHAQGVFIWSPPPAAADVALEQMCVSKHKRPENFHMVVVPRLMTGRWRKHLTRATDFYFKLDAAPLWCIKERFEPVLIFISLPIVTHRPRFAERNELLDKLEGLLLGSRVQEANQPGMRDSVRKLLGKANSLLRL